MRSIAHVLIGYAPLTMEYAPAWHGVAKWLQTQSAETQTKIWDSLRIKRNLSPQTAWIILRYPSVDSEFNTNGLSWINIEKGVFTSGCGGIEIARYLIDKGEGEKLWRLMEAVMLCWGTQFYDNAGWQNTAAMFFYNRLSRTRRYKRYNEEPWHSLSFETRMQWLRNPLIASLEDLKFVVGLDLEKEVPILV